MDEHSPTGSVRLRLLSDAYYGRSLEQLEYSGSMEVVRAELETLLREGRVELNIFVESEPRREDPRRAPLWALFGCRESEALPLDEALAALGDETSWTLDEEGDNPLFLRITKSGYEEYTRAYEEYTRAYPPKMFDPRAVRVVFEERMGVRLRSNEGFSDPDVERVLARVGATRQRSIIYESPKEAESRLGGSLRVTIDLDDLDGTVSEQRVRDYGLVYGSGGEPGGGSFLGVAYRANVRVDFLVEAKPPTRQDKATWSSLVSCLRDL